MVGANPASALGTPLWIWQGDYVGGADEYHCAGLSNDIPPAYNQQLSPSASTYGRKKGFCVKAWTRNSGDLWAAGQMYFRADSGGTWATCRHTYGQSTNPASTSAHTVYGTINLCGLSNTTNVYVQISTHTSYGFSTTGSNLSPQVGPYNTN